ncbi:Phox homologous domain-containing protein [Pyronema omphalodes]|nr:Phox homologous domain-containing protein [Pyronema omphalodes]
MSLQLTIPSSSEQHSPGKPYTQYHILVRTPIRSYTIKKRYTDFLALHDALTTHCNSPPPMKPPPKHWIGSTLGNPSRTEERRSALEAYLYAINNSVDSRWRDSSAWRSFLSLPASWTNNAAAKSPQLYTGGLPNGPITDPTLWLDNNREMKQLLHDARIQLNKRDETTVASEQRDASAAAKRCLVKASAIVAALDQGIQQMSAMKDKPLLEGEIRRRRDLVAAAKQERDGLEDLANKQSTARRSAGASDVHANLTAPKNGNGRITRVLGAPATLPETAETRELDNSAVLQMQNRILGEQDQGVGVLLDIVKRQRNMSQQIGQELEIQTEMLKQVDTDMDRVNKKTQAARRKAEGIS